MEIIIVCRAVWKYRFLPQAFSCSVFPGKENLTAHFQVCWWEQVSSLVWASDPTPLWAQWPVVSIHSIWTMPSSICLSSISFRVSRSFISVRLISFNHQGYFRRPETKCSDYRSLSSYRDASGILVLALRLWPPVRPPDNLNHLLQQGPASHFPRAAALRVLTYPDRILLFSVLGKKYVYQRTYVHISWIACGPILLKLKF